MRLEPRASRLGGPRTLGHCYRRKKLKLKKLKYEKKRKKKKEKENKKEKLSFKKESRTIEFYIFFQNMKIYLICIKDFDNNVDDCKDEQHCNHFRKHTIV